MFHKCPCEVLSYLYSISTKFVKVLKWPKWLYINKKASFRIESHPFFRTIIRFENFLFTIVQKKDK